VTVTREELGIRPGALAFWCGQAVFKYLPDFDDVFPRIAQGAGDCQFVFIGHPLGAEANEVLRARLERAFSACGLSFETHCVIVPPLDTDRFVAAIGQCDVVLDSIGWSGFNSTLESLAHGLPVVTVAAPLMRGRHTAAVLTMIGVTETIAANAEDYVSTAIRLAKDAEWRSAVRERMLANKDRAFGDKACIAGLEEFLERAARAPREP
jgi:predicted O-linked N-acetylglucosamine transferase (SPINDLY family)